MSWHSIVERYSWKTKCQRPRERHFSSIMCPNFPWKSLQNQHCYRHAFQRLSVPVWGNSSSFDALGNRKGRAREEAAKSHIQRGERIFAKCRADCDVNGTNNPEDDSVKPSRIWNGLSGPRENIQRKLTERWGLFLRFLDMAVFLSVALTCLENIQLKVLIWAFDVKSMSSMGAQWSLSQPSGNLLLQNPSKVASSCIDVLLWPPLLHPG